MKVGWLADDPGYLGGAELTMQEFAAASPEEIIECPPGRVVPGLDRYVIGNCAHYTLNDLEPMGDATLIRYVHDVWPFGSPQLRDEILRRARLIFTSPLHLQRFPHSIPNGLSLSLIPPAIDLDRFKSFNGQIRMGNVCIGRMAYGKGLDLLAEYDEPVDVYSSVLVSSQGNAMYRGTTTDVAETLSRYKRFVFLPTALEPFGRAVVEAWASGCELVLNKNVGARHWIEKEPKALETAAEDFWATVMA